jgi:hypothetical protein
VKIASHCLPNNHPHLASHLTNFAEFLRTTNRLQEAEPLLRKALAIQAAKNAPVTLPGPSPFTGSPSASITRKMKIHAWGWFLLS